MRTTTTLTLLTLGLTAAACDDARAPSNATDAALEDATPPVPDATQPAADATPPATDATPPAGDADSPDAAPALPLPEQAFAEPAPLPLSTWRVTDPLARDDVFERVLVDDYAPPDSAGVDADGLRWRDVTLEPDAPLPDPGNGLFYAATRITVDAETRVVALADRVLALAVNGHVQPGDVYGSGAMRVPLTLRAGENVLLVRAFGGRGGPAVRLWTTPDALTPNWADAIVPELPSGEVRPQHAGFALLNTQPTPVLNLRVEVAEDAAWHASVWTLPALAPLAATHVAAVLNPKAAPVEGEAPRSVTVRVSGDGLPAVYTHTLSVGVVPAGATHRETFLSGIDRSAQYFGVVPPAAGASPDPKALVLTLHGAGVQAIGQAAAYSAKDWAYIVAPTNRRPFGFDWEAWGRLDALETLEYAAALFGTDPTRVYLTGHSMGGHGTWNVGVHNPGRFATLGPSAGWSSFYTYGGEAKPEGAFGRARASSDTPAYLSNLARRGVYAIHGTADDNVPVTEGRTLVEQVRAFTDDVELYEQPGAGHWWDGDASAGADCVDWPPLFDFMRARTLDPFELDFTFRTPSPFITPRHSYVSLRSAESADADCVLTSSVQGDVVTLTTENVRSLRLNGDALLERGVRRVVVDGDPIEVAAGELEVGPQSGKRPGQHGPFDDVLQRPFCYAYATDDPVWQRYAAWQVSTWAHIGNGTACALPIDAVTPMLRATYNLVYVGAQPDQLSAVPENITWDDLNVTLNGTEFFRASLAYVYPEGDRLMGVLTTAFGEGATLWMLQPFSSRGALPDYLVYDARGGLAAGHFGPGWE